MTPRAELAVLRLALAELAHHYGLCKLAERASPITLPAQLARLQPSPLTSRNHRRVGSKMPAKDEFLALERPIDDHVANLPFWTWPITTCLSRFLLVANSLFGEPNAIRFGPARPEA